MKARFYIGFLEVYSMPLNELTRENELWTKDMLAENFDVPISAIKVKINY